MDGCEWMWEASGGGENAETGTGLVKGELLNLGSMRTF